MSLRCIAPVLLAALCLPSASRSQVTGLPEEYTLCIPPGAWVDLDTGMVLPQRTHRGFVADLRFDRDGLGFFVHLLHGGMAAGPDAEEPEGDWSSERQRLHRQDVAPRTWFARTDGGAVARANLTVANPYSTASAILRWATAPPALPLFMAAPRRLRVVWSEEVLQVSWRGSQSDYLVEVDDGQETRKHTVKGQQTRIQRVSGVARYRIRVRGLAADGAVTLPAETVRYAPRAAVRGAVEYPDNWYDVTGGLSLTRGEAADEDAEVVFYLYGIYVPGGGVQKVGHGAEAFHSLDVLPAEIYQPIHGRLDEDDVFAVRLPDGRCAKLWLIPTKGRDLRSGMQVRFAFLPDGRRNLMKRPANATFEYGVRGMELSWDPVGDATGYRVYRDSAKPLEVTVPRALVKGLERNRFHEISVTTIGPDGGESDRRRIAAHTYDKHHRVGTFALFADRRGGYDLVDDRAVARDADTVDLRIDRSGGGSQSLEFAAPHGIVGAAEWKFGEFPARPPSFAKKWESDGRFADVDKFLMVTRDGRWASVRIINRGYPNITLEYVLGPGR